MNETVSSDEEGYINQSEIKSETNSNTSASFESKEETGQAKDSILESLFTSSLTNNISRHKGHVIIPLSKATVSNVPNLTKTYDTRIEDRSTDLNTSSSSLNDEEDEEPISTRHHKWSFTAAAMKNRERSCQGWNENTSSSEEEEDDFDQFIENRKALHSTQNLNDTNRTEKSKKYSTSDFEQDHWQPYHFLSETPKSNDLFSTVLAV